MLKEKEIFKLAENTVKTLIEIEEIEASGNSGAREILLKNSLKGELRAYCNILQIDRDTTYIIFKNNLKNNK